MSLLGMTPPTFDLIMNVMCCSHFNYKVWLSEQVQKLLLELSSLMFLLSIILAVKLKDRRVDM